MAACGALGYIATSDVGRIAGGPAAARMRPVLKLRVRSVRRKVPSVSVSRAVATGSGAAAAAAAGDDDEEEQMMFLRRADAYFATDSRPIVLFDGVCNFCNAGVNFMLDNDPEGRVRMAALQSDAGRALLLRSGRPSDDLATLVLVEKDRSYIKSEGIFRTAQYLGNALPRIGTFGLLLPRVLRDLLYDNVANNRYSFMGKRDQCRVSDERFNDRFVV